MTQFACSIEVRLHPEGEYQPHGHQWTIEAETEEDAYEMAKKEASTISLPTDDYEVMVRPI